MGTHTIQNFGLVVLLIGICNKIASGISGCPLDDLEGPCECLAPFGQVFLVCNGVKSHLQIQKAMMKMEGRHISEFMLRDSNLRYIPYNVFSNTTLNRIKIFKTKLFYLFDRSLTGDVEGTLKEIVLEDISFDGGLDWNSFKYLKKLQLISLERVDVYQIPPNVERLELPEVETLIVSNGSLMFIYDRALRKFDNLRNLKLNQNELKSFNRSILSYPVTKLRHLDLSYNKISFLPKDMFDGTPELNALLLRGNNIYHLEEDFMSKIWNQLFFFDIADNPLNCDCYIQWIIKNERPYHLFGTCTSTSLVKDKSLVSLEEDDFIHCN